MKKHIYSVSILILISSVASAQQLLFGNLLEQSQDPVNIKGDVIFVGIAGHSTDGFWGLTKTGRVAGRKNFLSAGMDQTFQLYHNINVTLDGSGSEGLYWKVSTNTSNGYSYDTLLDSWNRPMFGMPYGDPEENKLWFDEANFSFETGSAEITMGRFYHASGPLFLARPHYAEFYNNPRVNNGQHILDGFRIESSLGGVDISAVLARIDDLKYTDGSDFTSLTGETLLGLELDFSLGDNGAGKLVHYWERDDETNAFVDSGEDQMRTFGAQANFAFGDINLSGTYSQTDYFLGNSSALNDDNSAMMLTADYYGGEWGATGVYGMVEGNFGAQGSWGRLGPYFNPANVDLVGINGWHEISDEIGVRAGYKRFETANSSDMGAFGIMSGDDSINVVEIAFDFDLADRWTMSLGWENIDGSLLGGEDVALDWYSADFQFRVNDQATVSIQYLFSDGQMPVTYNNISNSNWRGGALAIQGILKF